MVLRDPKTTEGSGSKLKGIQYWNIFRHFMYENDIPTSEITDAYTGWRGLWVGSPTSDWIYCLEVKIPPSPPPPLNPPTHLKCDVEICCATPLSLSIGLLKGSLAPNSLRLPIFPSNADNVLCISLLFIDDILQCLLLVLDPNPSTNQNTPRQVVAAFEVYPTRFPRCLNI